MSVRRSKRTLDQRQAGEGAQASVEVAPLEDAEPVVESQDSAEHSDEADERATQVDQSPQDDGENESNDDDDPDDHVIVQEDQEARHRTPHSFAAVAHASSSFDGLPLRMREAITREGLTLADVEQLSSEDFKVYLGFSLLEVATLRGHLARLRESALDLPESSPKRQRAAQPYGGASVSQDKFIMKVPTSCPQALPQFNADARRNPRMWFTGFENALGNLRYHPSTWLPILTMATKVDAEASEWVATLLNTGTLSYDMLKDAHTGGDGVQAAP